MGLLIDEIYKIFQTILRRAFVDIWVFLAPSAECFHCALIEFLQLFRDIMQSMKKGIGVINKEHKLYNISSTT